MGGGADLSPRQKMINMMYLVLMAMLALNVSKDILNAFVDLNDTFENGNVQAVKKTNLIYQDLAFRAQNNQTKYGKSNEIASNLKKNSQEIFDLLEVYKSDLIKAYATVDEKGRPDGSTMDNQEAAGIYLWGTPGTTKGDDLVAAIDKYRTFVEGVVTDDDLKKRLVATFNTEPVYDKIQEVNIPWIKKKFSGYPLAACITFLSDIQAKVRNAESEVVASLLQSDATGGIAVNKIQAIALPTTNYVMKGQPFLANVMLAAYDSTSAPEVLLYSKFDKSGKPIGDPTIKADVKSGKGVISIPTNAVGPQNWGGIIRLKDDLGKVTTYPFGGTYQVAVPAVVVSATKMNVMYRGVPNPITVSVPGFKPNEIKVLTPGAKLRKVGPGTFTVDVTSFRGREVGIVVSTTSPSGQVQTFPKKIYRVKEIPTPLGAVRGENETSMPLTNFKISKISAILKDFEFNLDLEVSSFAVKIPGQRQYKVRGNVLDSKVKKALNRVPIGETVQIRDIKAKIKGNSSYRVPKVIPASVVISSK